MDFYSMKPSVLTLSFLSLCMSQAVWAMSATDVKREEIIVFSRQGEAQLTQAIPQLQKLYQQTRDVKVRDDLITLLMRQSRFQEATEVCANCANGGFSENELENLGKAYRSVKNPQKALDLYVLLAKKHPHNPNGFLGAALVATESGQYKLAEKYLHQYQAKFGADAQFKEARSYLLNRTEPDLAKFGRWQDELKAEPKNSALALELYRLAAQLGVRPLQEKLMADYPDLFNAKDKNWLAHDETISSIRGNTSLKRAELVKAYENLTALVAQTETADPLYAQALADRLAVANRLNDDAQVLENYQQLQALEKPLPTYVEEAYADTLLRQGSPHQALAIYQRLEAEERQHSAKHDVNSALLFKLVSAASDAGQFALAQRYQDQIKEETHIWDFTKTTRLINPNYDRRFYSQVNLHNWRGNQTQAEAMLTERVQDLTPGDPWVMLALADFEAGRNHYDDANQWAQKAKNYLTDDEQVFFRNQRSAIALRQGDYATVSDLLKGYTEAEKESSASIFKQYTEARRGKFTAALGLSHPKDILPSKVSSNERTQEYFLYSPMTEAGHYIYAHQFETKVPTESENLRLQRLGVGANLNFFPLNVGIEAGSGTRLNDKGYMAFNAGYTLNQHWQVAAFANINSQNTPIKAIRQGVYANDYGFSTAYTYRNWLQAGAGVSQMKFDDGNTKKSFNAWVAVETFKHDRWALSNGIRYDYQRAKYTPDAYYYNPVKAQSIEFSADLSYFQPFDYGITLTHHLRGTVGRYKQTEQLETNNQLFTTQSSATTWAVSYAHDWRLNKKYSLSYEIGRKKNMYDGDTEFNNYGNVNLTISF